jgi:ATP-binding cassette subfamily C (CFTR/MRP) protein 1
MSCKENGPLLDPYWTLTDDIFFFWIEHARLKDHVASMSGGLEAKIHEG